jgi:hypothetical protein
MKRWLRKRTVSVRDSVLSPPVYGLQCLSHATRGGSLAGCSGRHGALRVQQLAHQETPECLRLSHMGRLGQAPVAFEERSSVLASSVRNRSHQTSVELDWFGVAIRKHSVRATCKVPFGVFCTARRLPSGGRRRSARRILLAGCDGRSEESPAKVLRQGSG